MILYMPKRVRIRFLTRFLFAIGGMFSTEDGVQDFLNWLQEESGYNADEKKTILQRITEWLNDIIEAIRDIMNSGELNGAGKFFAKENCDELTKIRKMFLEALDGACEWTAGRR